MPEEKLRIACFGFRSLPPKKGSAGADKFALELLPRMAAMGHKVVAYNRVYPDDSAPRFSSFEKVQVISIPTISRSGFDTLLHSAKVTYDIIRHNRADVVHIQNGGNSLFAVFLRLFGKRTYLSQDGLDWERAKWPWYAKIYLRAMSSLSAHIHNAVIFDNIFAREYFEKRFNKKFDFAPFGADVNYEASAEDILEKLGLEPKKYYLFVGRFIPDKGLHYLTSAFTRLKTDKKLVLVGGSPNPSEYEARIRAVDDGRVVFPGFVYGAGTHALMKNCYAYVQPSDVEGLSPVILESAFLGAPVICSDIPENTFGLREHGIYFRKSDADDLLEKLQHAEADPDFMSDAAQKQQQEISSRFSWDEVTRQHIDIFRR